MTRPNLGLGRKGQGGNSPQLNTLLKNGGRTRNLDAHGMDTYPSPSRL